MNLKLEGNTRYELKLKGNIKYQKNERRDKISHQVSPACQTLSNALEPSQRTMPILSLLLVMFAMDSWNPMVAIVVAIFFAIFVRFCLR